jgi:hypothetical protein
MFTKGPGDDTDSFGPNQYLYSTHPKPRTMSATLAHKSVPTETINGYDGRRTLQRGEVVAKITTGEFAGGVGPFQAGASDGRGDTDNLLGVTDTYVPWRANVRDVNIAVTYEAAVVKAWCFERDADGKRIPLSDATAAALRELDHTNLTYH